MRIAAICSGVFAPVASCTVGVDHPAVCACSDNEVSETPIDEPAAAARSFRCRNASGVPPASCAAGVAHPAVMTASRRFERPVSIRFA